MNDSGIISQYGFLYQRKVFILHALNHISKTQLITFEGRDDIEIVENDKIHIIKDQNCFIQVKSGHVSEECFSRIICNWLLIDNPENTSFELILENDLSFPYSTNERAKVIFDFILNGKDKKNSAIARKTYDKFLNQISSNSDLVIERIESLLTKFEKTLETMEEADKKITSIFYNDYCFNIIEYEIAKSKRLERFLSYINNEIDTTIRNKKPYTLLYGEFMRLILQVSDEISDKKYTVDVHYLKSKLEEPAKKIVTERQTREVKQLYLVDDNNAFVINGIVSELIYKDFRSVYEKRKSMEISNLELDAKDNYNSVKFSLEITERTPRSIYIKTIEKPIENELLPSGPIYRKGCYIYLSGDHIHKDYQITWGEENDA